MYRKALHCFIDTNTPISLYFIKVLTIKQPIVKFGFEGYLMLRKRKPKEPITYKIAPTESCLWTDLVLYLKAHKVKRGQTI